MAPGDRLMSTLIDLPAQPADQDETAERLTSYVETWRTSIASSKRADRPAAEAAIEGLYRNIGLEPPRIVWVASPLVGAVAYQSIGYMHRSLTSPYAKGDVGNGANREFNGLRDPFGFPTYAESSAWERVRNQLSGYQAATIDLVGEIARRTGATIRTEVQRRAPLKITEQQPVDATPVEVDERLGELLMGSSAEEFARLVGPDVFSVIAGVAVRHAFVAHVKAGGRMSWPTQAMQPGQLDFQTLQWAALESVLGRPFYTPADGSTVHRERLALRLQLARAAGPWWAMKGLALVSERPLTASFDAGGRLHAEAGPALAYGDGFTIHAWHGVTVDREVIETPETISVEAIDAESNAERRRVLVERIGFDRLVREGQAQIRHEDETGRLWERPMGPIGWQRNDESVVVVEVQNTTPEPDGSRKVYFLRVPPHTRTAREGVAWTFGMRNDEYAPRVES
jgi:hypothetical protein